MLNNMRIHKNICADLRKWQSQGRSLLSRYFHGVVHEPYAFRQHVDAIKSLESLVGQNLKKPTLCATNVNDDRIPGRYMGNEPLGLLNEAFQLSYFDATSPGSTCSEIICVSFVVTIEIGLEGRRIIKYEPAGWTGNESA